MYLEKTTENPELLSLEAADIFNSTLVNEMEVRDLLFGEVHYANTWDSAEKVIEMMETQGVKSIPVVDRSRQFVGVITERDVLSAGILLAADLWGSCEEESLLSNRIRATDLMDKQCITLSPEHKASHAALLMLESQLDCIPVVEGARLVGLLRHTDFTRMFASGMQAVKNAA